MGRKLFCEISPTTYKISVAKNRLQRSVRDAIANRIKGVCFSDNHISDPLPVSIYKHNSLIRRRLGNVNMELQENKAVNLSIAAPLISHILIRPGETFSFWRLVGKTSEKKGYKEGLQLTREKPTSGIGGGMCQMTNLIHWMILHSPLTIVEHHHHDGVDMFPDFGRAVPFGTGTSIFYNYLDYRFRNDTNLTFQLIIYTTDEYLCGELRADSDTKFSYHIYSENEHFEKEEDGFYRCGEVYRRTIDKHTGNEIKCELLRTNHAKVMYELKESEAAE